MSYTPNWQPGQILKAADLDAGFTGVETDISAVKTLATAAETAAAGAVQQSQLGTTVATLVGGLIPSGQLPAGVASFNGRVGLVSPVAADYLLGTRINIAKPVLSSFTYTLKSALHPPAIAQVQDAGDCLVMSQTCGISGSGSSATVAKAWYGLLKPWPTNVDSFTVCVEPDPFYVQIAGTTYANGSACPPVAIMLLDMNTTAAGKGIIAAAVGRVSYSDATSTLWSGSYLGTPAAGSTVADYPGAPGLITGATPNVASMPTSPRWWLRVTGLTTGTCTSWFSVDGRIWASLGSWKLTAGYITTLSHIGLGMLYSASPSSSGVASTLVANIKWMGAECADVNGNILNV